MKKYILFSLWLLILGCQNTDNQPIKDPLFAEVEASQSGIDFINTVENNEELNIFTYRNFYNGGGVAIGDLNNDGLSDIYFTANMGDNKLYINKGDWTFEDITEKAGVTASNKWSTGVVLVDINSDGFLDIYVCNAGYVSGQDQKNVLYLNNQDLTFTEAAAQFGLDDNGYTTHAAFLDYDKDGDLDVYLLNNSFIPTNTLNYSNKRELDAQDWPVKDFLKGGGDKFLRNDSGTFVDVSEEAGIYQSLIGFGLGVTVGDINNDGYDDLYISNDFFEKDYFYLNQKDGTFKESLEDYFSHISHSSMGADLRDVNNDGLLDLYVTDMLPNDDYRLKTTASFDDINLRNLKVQKGFYNQYMHNTLQINKGKKFKEVAFHAGVAASDWSWGALMFDADNDSYTDIFVCNGIYNDVIDLDFMDFFANDLMQQMALTGEKEDMNKVIEKMPSKPIQNLAFRNLSGLSFENVSANWGFDKETFSNGAAYGDLDNDGDFDLVVNNVNQPALIYQNTSTNKSIKLKLVGEAPNTSAVGAKVYLYTDQGMQYQQVNPTRGFQSSVDNHMVFGLGEDAEIDSLVIHWPDDRKSILHPESGPETQMVTPDNAMASNGTASGKNEMFAHVAHNLTSHKEDDFIDYYYERGLHRMLSKEGPKAAVADVNGDGLEDVFIGGAYGQTGSIYLQTSSGFDLTEQPVLRRHSTFEDTACAFFDADNDGDQDLFVGSGGNHFSAGDDFLKDRLYLNDGAGNFELGSGIKQGTSMNTAEVLPHDFDEDGDTDLIILSRSVPANYGLTPTHFVFENDGSGQFNDVTETVLSPAKGIGMISSAVFADITGDGKKELITVGEWEYPKVYEFEDKVFKELKTNLVDYSGWYYEVAAADLDNDGDQDLIFGNHGSNSYVHASTENPLSLFINDFDENQTRDKILTSRMGGKDMPIMLKKDMADQISAIKKQSIKHHVYATKSVQELFTPALIKESVRYDCNFMTSVVALNDGKGGFTLTALPEEAQLSSIKAVLPTDIDNDGDLDLLTGGNDFDLIPQFSRLDASFGGVLLNDGQAGFSFVDEIQSGLWIDGQVKDILPLETANGTLYIFIINNAGPVLVQSSTGSLEQ